MFALLLLVLTALAASPVVSAGKQEYNMCYNGDCQSFSCDYSPLAGIDGLKQCALSHDVFMLSTFGFELCHFDLASPTSPLVALSNPTDLTHVALMIDHSKCDHSLLTKIHKAIEAQRKVTKADEKLIKFQEQQLEKFIHKLARFKTEVNEALQAVTDAYQHDYLSNCEKDELWPIIELLNDILRTICGLEEDVELIQQQLKAASKVVQKECEALEKLEDYIKQWLNARGCSDSDAHRYLQKILKYAARVYNAQYKFVLISEGVELQLKALKTIRKVSERQFKGILTSLRVTLALIELQRLLKLGESASNLFAIDPRLSELSELESGAEQVRTFICEAVKGEHKSLMFVANQAKTLLAQGSDCQKLSDSDRTVLSGHCDLFAKLLIDLEKLLQDFCSCSSSSGAMDVKEQLHSIKFAIVEAVENVRKQSRGGPCSCDTITNTLSYLRNCHTFNVACSSDLSVASLELVNSRVVKDIKELINLFTHNQSAIKKLVQAFFALLEGKPIPEDCDTSSGSNNSTNHFCSECSASGSYNSYQNFQNKLAKHILYGSSGNKEGLMHHKSIAAWLNDLTKNRKFGAADLLYGVMDDQMRSLQCSALQSTSTSSRSDAYNSALKSYQSALHTKSSSSDVPFRTQSACDYWNQCVQNACNHYGMSNSEISQYLEPLLCTV